MNIVLSGLQGSGKTSCGYCLARMAGLPFYDIDHLILENYTSTEVKDIPSLYNKLGEKDFRSLEVQKVKSLFLEPSGIIALGGGTLASNEAEELVKRLGKIVYLYVPYTELEKRLKNRIEKRGVPSYLDIHDPYGSFKKIYERRHTQYEKVASAIVDTEGHTIQEIAQLIWTKATSQSSYEVAHGK